MPLLGGKTKINLSERAKSLVVAKLPVWYKRSAPSSSATPKDPKYHTNKVY